MGILVERSVRQRIRKGTPTGWFCGYYMYFGDPTWHRQFIGETAQEVKYRAKWNVYHFKGIRCVHVENKQGQIIAIYEKDKPTKGICEERCIGGR